MTDNEQCRFCNKTFTDHRKANRHRCSYRATAQEQYRDAVARYPDFKRVYPTWEAYDLAVVDGKIEASQNPIPDYVGQRQDIPEQPTEPALGDSGADSSGAMPEPDGGAQPAIGDIDLDDQGQTDGAAQPIAPNEPRQLAKTLGKLSTQAAILKSGLTKKQWGWRPIVALIHQGIMWATKAKERGAAFVLSSEQLKLLCLGYQNSFGDSPLLKIFKVGSEDDIDAFSAEVMVHGDVIIEGLPYLWDRAKEGYGKLRDIRTAPAKGEAK